MLRSCRRGGRSSHPYRGISFWMIDYTIGKEIVVSGGSPSANDGGLCRMEGDGGL